MKKGIALFLALVMMICFAGCGKKTASNDGIPVLKWYVAGDNQPGLAEVLEEANKISVEKIGAKLEMQFIDSGSYDERMRMIMSSGEKYDLCFTGYINKYASAARMGGLVELDEMLESTPALKEAVPEFFWEGARVDGKIYAVPNQQIVSGYNVPIVSKRLADKYGLDTEAVTDRKQLEPFMEAVKNGEEGIYPWRNYNAYFTVGASYEELLGGFGYKKRQDSVKIVFKDAEPEFIEGMKLRHEWYKKGYIRPDVVSVGDDNTDYLAGKYAISNTTYKPGVEINLESQLGEPWVPLKNIGKPFIQYDAVYSTLIGISRTSENKELALKLIELLNTDKEYYNLICYGIEGKHYEKVDENTIRFIENSNYKPDTSWMFGNQFNAYIVEGMDPDVWEQTKKMNDEAEKSALLGFVLSTDNIETEISQCETVRKQYGYSYFMGATSVEDGYDDYLARMKQAGADKIVKEIQRQVDEFFANKK